MVRGLIFLGVMAFAALIAWLAGYNFDKRSPDVAFFTVMATFLAAFLAACPYLDKR